MFDCLGTTGAAGMSRHIVAAERHVDSFESRPPSGGSIAQVTVSSRASLHSKTKPN